MKIERDLITKMIIAGVLGVLIIVVAVIGVSMLRNDDGPADNVPAAVLTEDEDEAEDEEEVIVPVEYERILGLVRGIDETTMQVYDIENNIGVTLLLDGTVRFEDEYGTQIVGEKIVPGEIVNIKYDKATYTPEQVKISPQIRVLKDLSSFTVDEGLKTIQIGSEIYNYTDELVALDGDEALLLADISVADDVQIRAYQGTIWSILVENGHGFIVLDNYSAYLDGRLEIGNRTSYTIIKDMRVPVAVGQHEVVITKEDMVSYTATIAIGEDEEYIIDLGEFAPKIAEVDIAIAQENSTLYVDGVLTEITDEPLTMDFGQYELKVTNPGYMDWEGILVVDQTYIKQVIDMEVEPLQLHMTGPDGAEFYLDGVLVGVISGYQSISVPVVPGGHVLTLRKDGHESWSQSVYIEDTGEDYYYTVSDLAELPKEPEPEPEPVPVPEDPVEGEGDEGQGDDDSVSDDVYGDD